MPGLLPESLWIAVTGAGLIGRRRIEHMLAEPRTNLAISVPSDALPSPLSREMTSGENHSFPWRTRACRRIGGTADTLAIPRPMVTASARSSRTTELERRYR